MFPTSKVAFIWQRNFYKVYKACHFEQLYGSCNVYLYECTVKQEVNIIERWIHRNLVLPRAHKFLAGSHNSVQCAYEFINQII